MPLEGADGVFFGDPEGQSETHNLDLTTPEVIQEARDPNTALVMGGSVPGEPLTPAKKDEPVEAGEALDPITTEQPRKKSVQARIDKLVRRNHEAQNENETLRAQIAALSQQVLTLSGHVTQQPTPRFPTPAGNVTQPTDNLFGEEAVETPAKSDGDIVKMIESVVQRSIAPLVQRERAKDEMLSLRAQHEAAFAEAVQEYPELADSSSELRETFNSLFDGVDEKFRNLPNSPVMIAHMARGMLADQRRSEQKQSDRKRAAAVHTPKPATTDAPSSPGRVSKDTIAAVEAARKRLREGSRDLNDFKLVREFGRFQQFGPRKQS